MNSQLYKAAGREIAACVALLSAPCRKGLNLPAELYSLIARSTFNRHSDAVVTANSRWTWSDLTRLTEAAATQLADLHGKRVGVVHTGDGSSWANLAALDHLAADVYLLPPSASDEDIERVADEFQLAAVVDGSQVKHFDKPAAGSGQSSVVILTSGTSGRPKAVRHTWATLSRPVRKSSNSDRPVWLLTYRPNLYAGIQVALQCFANGGTLVVPEAGADVDQIVSLMLQEEVALASATPSYWRQLMLFGDDEKLRQVPLRQITVGGEIVDQQVLDQLTNKFLQARIVHIYATSELGRCFSVIDGKAGFPADFVGKPLADGVELKIDEGQLFVRSANAMVSYDSGDRATRPSQQWIATGDLVRREADRWFFVGRQSDIINVGGNKVHPQEVEPVLRQVPGVADVRVYGQTSSLAGQLVAAQIVVKNPSEANSIKAKIMEAGVRHLAAHQRPRLIEIVERIELSEAGKTARSNAK